MDVTIRASTFNLLRAASQSEHTSGDSKCRGTPVSTDVGKTVQMQRKVIQHCDAGTTMEDYMYDPIGQLGMDVFWGVIPV